MFFIFVLPFFAHAEVYCKRYDNKIFKFDKSNCGKWRTSTRLEFERGGKEKYSVNVDNVFLYAQPSLNSKPIL